MKEVFECGIAAGFDVDEWDGLWPGFYDRE